MSFNCSSRWKGNSDFSDASYPVLSASTIAFFEMNGQGSKRMDCKGCKMDQDGTCCWLFLSNFLLNMFFFCAFPNHWFCPSYPDLSFFFSKRTSNNISAAGASFCFFQVCVLCVIAVFRFLLSGWYCVLKRVQCEWTFGSYSLVLTSDRKNWKTTVFHSSLMLFDPSLRLYGTKKTCFGKCFCFAY